MDPYSALQPTTPASSKCMIVEHCIKQRDAKVITLGTECSRVGLPDVFPFLVSSSIFSTPLVQLIWFRQFSRLGAWTAAGKTGV